MVGNVAQGRGHDELGSFEVRFLRVGFVQNQVLDECFDKDRHPPLTRLDSFTQCFHAAEMDDVSVCPGQRGEGHQVVDALGFDIGRTAVVVRVRSGATRGEELFLQLGDEGFVLAVGGDDDPEFLGQLQRFPKLGIVHTERAFVSEEDFEAAHALLDDFAQLFGRIRIEAGYAHVECVIAAGLTLGLRLPRGESFGRGHVARRADHFENGRGASDKCGFGARLVVVLRIRAHEGQVDVGVGVDEARKDVFACGINHLRTGGRRDVLVDASDGFGFA